MPAERPARNAVPGSLLSQWWTLGALTRDKRARSRHFRVLWVILDRYMQGRGKGRASIRYIAKATGLSHRAVVAACRELTDWGYTQRIVGSGSRPSEYMPNWITAPPSTTSNAIFGVVSGTHDDSTIGTHEGHTKSLSGTHGGSESDLLLTGLKAGLVVSEEVSASGPGAEAPAVAGREFERIWIAYGRYGNKQASRRAFEAITDPDVDHIVSRAAAWAASAKPGQRRMPLEKWLEQERYDEADRAVKARVAPISITDEADDEEEVDVRRKQGADHFAIAEAARRVRQSAIEYDVPSGVPVTIIDSALVARGGDSWLQLQTDHGGVAVLLEAHSALLQEAGQEHFGRLCSACRVNEVNDSSDLHGKAFMIVRGTFAELPEEQAA